MSILYVADPGHEDAIRRIGLGTKLLYLVGCWLGDRCTQRGVSDWRCDPLGGDEGVRGADEPCCFAACRRRLGHGLRRSKREEASGANKSAINHRGPAFLHAWAQGGR
jgi:hypothetical protein